MRCRFPGSSLDASFAWAPNHPVVDAYRAFKPMPYDAPSRALAAVLHAVSPDDNYFRLVGARDDYHSGRRPDTVHTVSRGQASLPDRPAGSEGARSAGLRADGQLAASAASRT